MNTQTGEVTAVLCQADGRTAFIRSRRDALHITVRGWQEVLGKWDSCIARSLDECRELVEETCRFLAPRFMVFQEWKKANERQAAARPRETVW